MSKWVKIPEDSKVNDKIIEKLDHFLETVTPGKLKNHLFRLFIFYIIHEHDSLPDSIEDIAFDFYSATDFLIALEDEIKD